RHGDPFSLLLLVRRRLQRSDVHGVPPVERPAPFESRPGARTPIVPLRGQPVFAARPGLLPEAPDLPYHRRVDALSDALRVLRLTGAVFLDSEFTAPWCVLSEGRRPVTEPLPPAGNVIFFHLLTEGRCKARLASGGETIELQAGDLVLMSRDDNHLMGSDLSLEPVPAAKLVRSAAASGLMRIDYGGGGERTRFGCSFLICDERLSAPLLDSLPRILRIPLGEGPAVDWLRNLMQAGNAETAARRPGGATVLAKLSELLFVEGMRRYAESLPDGAKGWLAGLRDRFVGRALALMHERPEHDWAVDELAEKVGLSRSALAQRFTELLGQPPMQYLMRWRLTIAAQRLREEKTSISRVAADIGYESEAAFNRAFKRTLGETPAAWRRSTLTA
ncbi:MAG TPA: AraC family transcriptional regulator, partial [Burkholderiaceae bacterium]